eukprot:1126761-Rhodomonas_salina.1
MAEKHSIVYAHSGHRIAQWHALWKCRTSHSIARYAMAVPDIAQQERSMIGGLLPFRKVKLW